MDNPDGGREVGTVGGSAALVTPSSSSSAKPTPYSTPNPGDGAARWMEAVLATERSDEYARECERGCGCVSAYRSVSGSGVRVSVSRDEIMLDSTVGLAALLLTRLGMGRR